MATTEPTVRTSTSTRSFIVRDARGGNSGGAIVTGVVVAFGAMGLIGGLVSALVVTFGGLPESRFPGTEVEGGLVAAIFFVLAEFLSYLWGGYAAGRMARGAGVANGLLVPLIAILLLIVVGAIVAVLSTSTGLGLPFQSWNLPTENNVTLTWGAGIGIAVLLAMFLGGGLGGALGTRWHSRLERDAVTKDPDPPAPTSTSNTSTTSSTDTA